MGIEKILNNLLTSDVFHGKGTQILKLTDEIVKTSENALAGLEDSLNPQFVINKEVLKIQK